MSEGFKYWYRLGGHPDGRQTDPAYRQDVESGYVYDATAADDAPPDLLVSGDNVRRLGAAKPWFVIRSLVFTNEVHPFGAELAPWYEIRCSPRPDPVGT
jgi:hypothetical protein